MYAILEISTCLLTNASVKSVGRPGEYKSLIMTHLVGEKKISFLGN